MTSNAANKSTETLAFTSIARNADRQAADKIRALIASALVAEFKSIAHK